MEDDCVYYDLSSGDECSRGFERAAPSIRYKCASLVCVLMSGSILGAAFAAIYAIVGSEILGMEYQSSHVKEAALIACVGGSIVSCGCTPVALLFIDRKSDDGELESEQGEESISQTPTMILTTLIVSALTGMVGREIVKPGDISLTQSVLSIVTGTACLLCLVASMNAAASHSQKYCC